MRKTVSIASIVALFAVLAVGWYAGSPVWTLKQMAAAASDNDAARLATYIDFPSVRASLKADFKAEAGQALLDGEGDGFEKLGAAIGAVMADSLIDALVTPESLRKMLSGQSSSGALELSLDLRDSDAEIVRDSLSQFRLRNPNGSALVFHRRWLSWKLVALRSAELPADDDAIHHAETSTEETLSSDDPSEEVATYESDPPYSAAYAACMDDGDAANGMTSAMTRCSEDETERQDLELNRVFKVAMAKLEAPESQALRQRQRNWIKLRDAQCEEESADEAGSLFGEMMLAGCLARETTKRVNFLRSYLREREIIGGEQVQSAWELEAGDGCTIHQKQGTTTVLLAGDASSTVFGFSQPKIALLPNKEIRTFEVYFDGPALVGRENKWGDVQMVTTPYHNDKAFLFAAPPSFLESINLHSTVTFINVLDRQDRTTIVLSNPRGTQILRICTDAAE